VAGSGIQNLRILGLGPKTPVSRLFYPSLSYTDNGKKSGGGLSVYTRVLVASTALDEAILKECSTTIWGLLPNPGPHSVSFHTASFLIASEVSKVSFPTTGIFAPPSMVFKWYEKGTQGWW
jgi:hypothetical protein